MNQKTTWIVVIVIVVLVLIGVVVWSSSNNNSYTQTGSYSTSTATSTSSSTGETQGTQVGAIGGSGIPYSNALKVYMNKRIQFSNPTGMTSCQATPTSVTFKGGTAFMLDNRMPKTATIHFSSGVSYSLPPYSFEIVSLVTPRTYVIDCNSSQNVATVEIQK